MLYLRMFTIIPLVAKLALMLMVKPISIPAIIAVLLELLKVAAPDSKLPSDKIQAGALWVEKALADKILTDKEIIELAQMMDIKVKISVPLDI